MSLYISPSLPFLLTAKHFELSFWQDKPHSERLAGGRGASQKIQLNDKPYVLRRYLRGGLMAKLSYDRYVFLGEQQTRPFREKAVLDYAQKQGLAVPACVAYLVQKQGLFYRAAIMTEYLPNSGTLASFLQQQALTEQQWQQLAVCIKQMHQARINHADLNADNILLQLDSAQSIDYKIIDFDKATIEKANTDWPMTNIQRLKRSLDKINPQNFNEAAWDVFLKAYQSK